MRTIALPQRRATCALLLLAASAAGAPLAAQSDILLQLRSGSPAGDRFRVDSAGGFVAIGNLGIGITPATGCGDRTMWDPFHAAFRAGSPGDANGCSAWDFSSLGFYSIASGYGNHAQGIYSAAFGNGNSVLAQAGTAFGNQNTIPNTGSYGVAGGALSHCGGTGCVALGFRVSARANFTVALGNRVSTGTFTGAFVWGDGTSSIAAADDSVLVTANNQFALRASGGLRFFTNATASTGVTMNAGGSSWNVVSDRARKEHFLDVDGEGLLERLRAVPVTTWRYRDEEDRSVRHIGPMAQDWKRAFGFSGDSTTINSGDFDGVNLAAVQALDARTRGLPELERQVAALAAENAELRARLARLEALLEGADPR